jgi:hypothetical protein
VSFGNSCEFVDVFGSEGEHLSGPVAWHLGSDGRVARDESVMNGLVEAGAQYLVGLPYPRRGKALGVHFRNSGSHGGWIDATELVAVERGKHPAPEEALVSDSRLWSDPDESFQPSLGVIFVVAHPTRRVGPRTPGRVCRVHL